MERYGLSGGRDPRQAIPLVPILQLYRGRRHVSSPTLSKKPISDRSSYNRRSASQGPKMAPEEEGSRASAAEPVFGHGGQTPSRLIVEI